jgi:nicotinate-nucleotide pyrophosphorylase (carboxylating)
MDPAWFDDVVRRALAEDLGEAGDLTTEACVPAEARSRASIVTRRPGTVAGLPLAACAFHAVDPETSFVAVVDDGAGVDAGTVLATVHGRSRALLTAERTALNLIGWLSGIATATTELVRQVEGTGAHICDTRKTTPTLRALEKYAVRVGGGANHRYGLYDAFLIKDNHIRVAGGIARAVQRARRSRPELPVEVEAQSLQQVDEALEAGVDVLLVDNLPVDVVAEAVARARGRARVEISGGVTLDRIPAIAATGADFVSVGALTHSAPAADISLEIEIEAS